MTRETQHRLVTYVVPECPSYWNKYSGWRQINTFPVVNVAEGVVAKETAHRCVFMFCPVWSHRSTLVPVGEQRDNQYLQLGLPMAKYYIRPHLVFKEQLLNRSIKTWFQITDTRRETIHLHTFITNIPTQETRNSFLTSLGTLEANRCLKYLSSWTSWKN